MGRPQRVGAELRHAEIGGAAGDLDVGDEEAHLRAIDVERRRLDIDGEVGPRQLAGPNERHERLHAGADAGARLAALLVADEGEDDVAGQLDAGMVERAQRLDRRGDAGLEVGGAATPDLAVDDRRAEWVLALGAGPALAPAADMNDVGVADNEQALAAAGSLASRRTHSAGREGNRGRSTPVMPMAVSASTR